MQGVVLCCALVFARVRLASMCCLFKMCLPLCSRFFGLLFFVCLLFCVCCLCFVLSVVDLLCAFAWCAVFVSVVRCVVFGVFVFALFVCWSVVCVLSRFCAFVVFCVFVVCWSSVVGFVLFVLGHLCVFACVEFACFGLICLRSIYFCVLLFLCVLFEPLFIVGAFWCEDWCWSLVFGVLCFGCSLVLFVLLLLLCVCCVICVCRSFFVFLLCLGVVDVLVCVCVLLFAFKV